DEFVEGAELEEFLGLELGQTAIFRSRINFSSRFILALKQLTLSSPLFGESKEM
ncbi:9351_t:CDS:2, partial [Gigaspora rosea]